MSNYFTSITIIYNPKSTGSGKKLSQQLQADLATALPRQKVDLLPTKFAGHAEELAERLALESKRPLIISASGDGGYHEVINGLVKAMALGAKPIAGLLPAGNANDHHRNVHRGEIVTAIRDHQTQVIDLLKLTGKSDGKSIERYAHSYIGLGLTPQVGQELNKTELNPVKEVFITMRSLFTLKPVWLVIRKRTMAYESIILSNVPTMSKYFPLSRGAKVSDGKFEVTIFKRRNKFVMFTHYLLWASRRGPANARQAESFAFRTLHATPIQLDGELLTLDADSAARVTIKHRYLRCIV